MQVQQQPRPHQQEISKTDIISVSQQGEDWSIEGLIFPQLIREGLGHVCDYCRMKNGQSVAFTSFVQYAKHVLYNHEGYSIYVFDKDVKKYKEELKTP